MRRLIKFFSWAAIALTVLLFIYGIAEYSSLKSISQEAILSYGLPAVFILTFFLDLFPQFLSGHNLILVAGFLGKSNAFYVILVALTAAFLASVLGFLIGKNLEKEIFEEIFGKKIYKKIEGGMKRYGKWYVAISAISPLPYVPLIFGGLDMSWSDFIVYGVIPRMLGFIVTALFAYYALPFVIQYFGI